jgi:hypothetical protein
VLAVRRGRWLVPPEGTEPLLLPARTSLRDDPPVTGDCAGAIAAVLERRGALVWLASGGHASSQVLTANVHLVRAVELRPTPTSAGPSGSVALAGGLRAVLVLTKAGLVTDGQTVARMAGGSTWPTAWR